MQKFFLEGMEIQGKQEMQVNFHPRDLAGAQITVGPQAAWPF